MPRLTQTQRDSISAPDFGLLILNTSTNCINLWLGATWKQICGDCDFATPVPGNSGPICQGQSLNLTATTIQGATYQWSGPNGFTSNLQNPTINNASAGASGSYSVQATLNGCTTQPQSTVATVNAIPQTPTASNTGPACVGQNITLSSTTIAGAGYNWSGPNGFSANTQNPDLTNIQLNNAGNYNVVASVSGCNSEASTTTVVINATPSTPGTISGASAVCANATGVVYYINRVAGAASYNWTVPAGASISANADTAITVSFGNNPAGSITVSATNICGTSSQSTLVLTQSFVCSPYTYTYTGNEQTFTVPAGITSVTIAAYGAQGSGQYGNGALGGMATGTITATPGQLLYVFVGGQNGYNGGGAGGNGNTGGGMSDVRIGGTGFGNWVIVAGGGGGGGNNGNGYLNTTTGTGGGGSACANGAGGGGGGYYNGYSYSSQGGAGTCGGGGASGNSYGGWAGGGGGGGLTGGGDGGATGGYGNPGNPGTQGQGGDYGYNSACGGSSGGSGGGGGYYGGGGSASGQCASGSGGGGSSWASGAMTNTSFSGGVQSGNGQVVISW